LALASSPNDEKIISWSGFIYWIYGDVDKAIPILRRTSDLDPLNSEGCLQLATLYTYVGNFAEAENAVHRASNLNRDGRGVHEAESEILRVKGSPEAALIENDKILDERSKLAGHAILYYRLGRTHEADAALAKYIRDFADKDSLQVAEIYGFRGAKDDAFVWLDRAYQKHEVNVAFVKTDLYLSGLRGDARFKAFLRKMNLPEL
jgi:tetratricopeptide (TPR) repeat protein